MVKCVLSSESEFSLVVGIHFVSPWYDLLWLTGHETWSICLFILSTYALDCVKFSIGKAGWSACGISWALGCYLGQNWADKSLFLACYDCDVCTMTCVLSAVPRLPVEEGPGCLLAADCSVLSPAQHHQQGQGWCAERQWGTHCVRGKVLLRFVSVQYTLDARCVYTGLHDTVYAFI